MPKLIVLPRQARDKHRESAQKERCVFLQSDALLLSDDTSLGTALLGPSTEEKRSFCYRLQRHATESMGSSWSEKDVAGKAMYAFEAVVHLLRALTTPVTPQDNELRGRNWNRGFERLRASLNPPWFAAFFAFWVLRRLHDEEYLQYMQPFPFGNPPLLAFCGGVPVGVAVWCITADGVRAAIAFIHLL